MEEEKEDSKPKATEDSKTNGNKVTRTSPVGAMKMLDTSMVRLRFENFCFSRMS